MTRETRLRVASNECMAGRPILRRTCAQPIKIRVIPENEIPRALHVDIYFVVACGARAVVCVGVWVVCEECRCWCGVVWCVVWVWRCGCGSSFGGKPFFRKRTVFPRPPFPKKLSLSYTLFYCCFISRTGYILFRQNNLHRFISF